MESGPTDNTKEQPSSKADSNAQGNANEPPPGDLSILPAGLTDAPAEKDSLGFKPYVQAIKEFLLSPHTKAPLTLSIEGPWGSGKSSFMTQLRNEIAPEKSTSDGRTKKRRRAPNSPPIVEFNPWRHDKEEALWAAFALSFVKQISKQCPRWKRIMGTIQLFFARFDWLGGGFQALRAVAISMTLLICAIGIPILMLTQGTKWAEKAAYKLSKVSVKSDHKEKTAEPPQNGDSTTGTPVANSAETTPGSNNLKSTPSTDKPETSNTSASALLIPIIQAGGWSGSITLFLYLLYSIKKILGNPFEINLRKHIRSPDYEGNTAFIENFQSDFNKILDAYVGKLKEDLTLEQGNKLKTFVFIDDLDRCDLPKAAELMNAINLLISEDRRLIFIIGMDRQKVAAAVASKYRDLLPFLLPRVTSEGSAEIFESSQALAFGYAFLEKFIQLPFTVPAPNDIDAFLKDLSLQEASDQALKEITSTKRDVSPLVLATKPVTQKTTSHDGGGSRDSGSRNEKTEEEREQFILGLGRDSNFVRETAKWVSRTFDYNPRRLKQFINLFRLRLYIADLTGCLDKVGNDPPALTPEQIAKLTAILMRWPNFAEAWFKTPLLLEHLTSTALGYEKSVPGGWSQQEDLLALLRLDPTSSEKLSLRFSLHKVKLESVLRIVPARELTRAQRVARQALQSLGSEYVKIRASLAAGPERTQIMNAIFGQMRNTHPDAKLKDEEIRRLFSRSDGDRIAGLAAVDLQPNSKFADVVLPFIEEPNSPFEQYHALRCATKMLHSFNVDQRTQLQQALKQSFGSTITEADPSRWNLAEELQRELQSINAEDLDRTKEDLREFGKEHPNSCDCPKPPGGRTVCAAHQLAICRVREGITDAECIDPPFGPSKHVRFANWALSEITGYLRLEYEILTQENYNVLQGGFYVDEITGERVSFSLPKSWGNPRDWTENDEGFGSISGFG
jgi:hypothetical protein